MINPFTGGIEFKDENHLTYNDINKDFNPVISTYLFLKLVLLLKKKLILLNLLEKKF